MQQTDFRSANACNLCGGHDVTVVSRRSRSGRPLRSVACTGCGLVWSDPRPHDTRTFYADDYRLAYKQTFEPRPKHVLRAGHVALDRLRKIRDCVSRERMHVLDVGSGGGEFAYLLKKLGHEVTGAEPNNGYAAYSERQYGLRIRRGFIGDMDLPPQSFDLVTIWHVLEHTEDPAAVLTQLHAALRPGGTLVVEVPNVLATCQSPRSSFHEAHLYTFGIPTLSALARKAGFMPVSIQLSADAGNLTARFEALAAHETAPCAVRKIAGNHAHVTSVIAAHTQLSHALSVHPFKRAAGRLWRAVSERLALRSAGVVTGRELLDKVYARGLVDRATPSSRRHVPRAWLVGAYLFAIATEELLVDRLLPMARLGEQQSLVVYAGIQCVVVGALLWTFVWRRPGSVQDAARAGAWTVPLFAVPALC
jgi:2-polyprenyl-3-methyl-5-hydroxy-6-metoxy-1,4-benzoquinol methylase